MPPKPFRIEELVNEMLGIPKEENMNHLRRDQITDMMMNMDAGWYMANTDHGQEMFFWDGRSPVISQNKALPFPCVGVKSIQPVRFMDPITPVEDRKSQHCPFCAGTDIEYGQVQATCKGCGACGPISFEGRTPDDARKLWESRLTHR